MLGIGHLYPYVIEAKLAAGIEWRLYWDEYGRLSVNILF